MPKIKFNRGWIEVVNNSEEKCFINKNSISEIGCYEDTCDGENKYIIYILVDGRGSEIYYSDIKEMKWDFMSLKGYLDCEDAVTIDGFSKVKYKSITVKATFEFEVDTEDFLDEYLDVPGLAIELTKNEVSTLKPDDFNYEIVGHELN